MCGAGSWHPGARGCSVTAALGACVREDGAFVEYRYPGPPNNYSAAGARRACADDGGVWRDL